MFIGQSIFTLTNTITQTYPQLLHTLALLFLVERLRSLLSGLTSDLVFSYTLLLDGPEDTLFKGSVSRVLSAGGSLFCHSGNFTS
jgi:hypothetical protein